MTANEMSDIIGAQVYLEAVPGLQVLCLVTNAKTAYGVPRLEIIPLGTSGRAWVNLSRTTPTPQKQEGR